MGVLSWGTISGYERDDHDVDEGDDDDECAGGTGDDDDDDDDMPYMRAKMVLLKTTLAYTRPCFWVAHLLRRVEVVV